MKHMFLRSTSVLLLSAALLVAACKKGDTGPAGEKGEKGDAGATGTTGATGKAGTANVIYSAWQDVTFNLVDSFTAVGTITAPKIVDSIIQKGEVKVFWNINTASSPTIVALPYHDNGVVFGLSDLANIPLIRVGTIALYSNYNLSSRTNSSGEKVFQYRYIIIPGGVSARSAVNWDDYNQVKSYLGLKD